MEKRNKDFSIVYHKGLYERGTKREIDTESGMINHPNVKNQSKKCSICGSLMDIKPISQEFVIRPDGIFFVTTTPEGDMLWDEKSEPSLIWVCSEGPHAETIHKETHKTNEKGKLIERTNY